MIFAPLLAQATSRLGIVPTVSTFAYHPYQVARSIGTLDQVSAGQASWNMVTGSSNRAGVFADPDKVHPIDFQGKYFASRCPLNSGPLA
jgi:alkanesulfonate monooxygenase SsuD/methylene tetrahydromethanopterin reductase-like flavin-dependent oxidoreductase (luciferase family)